jgi:predicted DNA-binding transcriptional regulator YafY
MPNGEKNKIRVLAIYRLMLEKGKMSVREIQEALDARYDIQADRKTVMSDIKAIDRFVPIKADTGLHGGFQRYDPWEECGWKST